jgi:hypothetical protein
MSPNSSLEQVVACGPLLELSVRRDTNERHKEQRAKPYRP